MVGEKSAVTDASDDADRETTADAVVRTLLLDASDADGDTDGDAVSDAARDADALVDSDAVFDAHNEDDAVTDIDGESVDVSVGNVVALGESDPATVGEEVRVLRGDDVVDFEIDDDDETDGDGDMSAVCESLTDAVIESDETPDEVEKAVGDRESPGDEEGEASADDDALVDMDGRSDGSDVTRGELELEPLSVGKALPLRDAEGLAVDDADATGDGDAEDES